MDFWALIALVMTAELGLHYFPWRMLLKGRDLPRVAAYVLGVCGLMIPFSAWLWRRGEIGVIQTLWLVIAAGGLTVMALYGLDRMCKAMKDAKSQVSAATVKLMEKQ